MSPYELETLRGKEVVISGDFRMRFGRTQAEMVELARRAGARHVGHDVRRTTEVFVKGHSKLYKHNSFGQREAVLAERAPKAVVISGEQFFALLALQPVEGRPPQHAPDR